MKFNLKKIASVALTGAMLLGGAISLPACTDIEDDNRFNETVNKEKTQLYVGYYNGGYGLTWLKEAKERFEALYPDYQIMIDTGKDEYLSDTLRSNIKTNRQDMYVGVAMTYNDFLEDGTLLDLTEAMQTPLTEFGETKTIEEKMNESLKNWYQTSDGKYYAVPYAESYHHMIYDVDLFDEYNLWFKDGGGFVSSTEDKKSAGQDGVYGTYDDGLPVTYSDFFALCDRMVARGITPLTWNGIATDAYLTNFMANVIADYEGENFNTNYSYNGKTTILKSYDFTESAANTFVLDPSVTETVTVTSDNFQDYMYRTTGKYYAAKFAKDLVSNPAYRTYNYAESHTACQRSYLMSNMDGVNKPIAMLIEGEWWMNEATEVFKEMAAVDEKYSMENRRFGIMPIPKADDDSSADGHTVAPFSGGWTVCISAKTDKADIATEFFRFLHTDEIMKLFTQHSNCFRAFEYDVSDIYDELPYYTQTLLEAREQTTFIYKFPQGDDYKTNSAAEIFMTYMGFMGTQLTGISTYNMMSTFCDHSELSALDYVAGMKKAFDANIPASLKN